MASSFSLILDIQSGLVRGALVTYGLNDKAHILYVTSKTIPHTSEADGAYLTKMMLSSLEEVAAQIVREGMFRAKSLGYTDGSPHTVEYVLSSPWIFSQSKTLKVTYDHDVEITDSLIKNSVNAEREASLKKFKEGKGEGEFEFDLAFIEQKIFDVRLNGYSVVNYKGKSARNLEISFALTLSSEKIIEMLHNALAKTFHIRKQAEHSALLLHYIALRALSYNHDEYISLHVHGELTDIVIVKKGISSYLASFPFGTVTLLRKAAEAFGNSEEMSDSLISLYENDKLEDGEKEKVEKILLPLITLWQEECLKTLNMIGEKTVLPRLMYLSTHNHFELFKKALSPTEFEIVTFDNTLVDKVVTFEKASEKSTLMAMYAYALKNSLEL